MPSHGKLENYPVEEYPVTGRARYIKLDRQHPGAINVVDTGEDSVFLMHGRGPSWDRDPDEIPVHMHTDVDEMIILLDEQEGFYLHGTTPDSMVKSTFKGPCVLMLPAGEYHRIVTTSEGDYETFLTYTPANSTLQTFSITFGGAIHAKVKLSDLPLEELDPEKPVPTKPDRQAEKSK
jgi:uncharacterized protein YjlB